MQLVTLSPEDAAACEALSLDNAWSVGEPRWRMLLELGEAHGLRRDDGSLAGCAMLFDYEGAVAVAAMVLVRLELQGRGLGRRLMEGLLADAPPATYLFATEQGRLLYEKLGFVAQESLARRTGRPRPGAEPNPARARLRPLRPGDLEPVVTLDAAAFGARRAAVLRRLVDEACGALVAERDGRIAGYGLALEWPRDVAIGPVIAEDEGLAVALCDALARPLSGIVRVDFPARWTRLEQWAQGCGLQSEPAVSMMTVGGVALPGQRERLFAVASRGLG